MSTRVLVTGKPSLSNSRVVHAYGGINYTLTDDTWRKTANGYTRPDTLTLPSQISSNQMLSSETLTAWSDLPGTQMEVTSIAAVLNKKGWTAQTITGNMALEDVLKANIGTKAPNVLHIATHGFFFPDEEIEGADEESVYRQADDPMLRSGLILAGGNRSWQQQPIPDGVENGILTAYEVAQLDLRNTDLVVLSACETGLGDVQGSEGVYGLQRAFKQAGANYLLISLWKVPDAQTVELMETFYKNWLKGTDLPTAFRKAQLAMSEKYSPYEWAAFKLVR